MEPTAPRDLRNSNQTGGNKNYQEIIREMIGIIVREHHFKKEMKNINKNKISSKIKEIKEILIKTVDQEMIEVSARMKVLNNPRRGGLMTTIEISAEATTKVKTDKGIIEKKIEITETPILITKMENNV